MKGSDDAESLLSGIDLPVLRQRSFNECPAPKPQLKQSSSPSSSSPSSGFQPMDISSRRSSPVQNDGFSEPGTDFA